MTAVTDMRPWHDFEGGTTLSRAKGCLNLYNNLDQGMGSFMFGGAQNGADSTTRRIPNHLMRKSSMLSNTNSIVPNFGQGGRL